MRIRTQLFLGIALLAASLIAIQWWIQQRQLEAINQELSEVATTIGRFFFQSEGGALTTVEVAAGPKAGHGGNVDVETHTIVEADAQGGSEEEEKEGDEDEEGDIPKQVFVTNDIEAHHTGETGPQNAHSGYKVVTHTQTRQAIIKKKQWIAKEEIIRHEVDQGERLWVGVEGPGAPDPGKSVVDLTLPHGAAAMDVHLEAGFDPIRNDNVLIIQGLPGGDREIPLNTHAQGRVVEIAFRDSLMATGLLLLAGLLGAAIFSDRVSRPLRQLAHGAEAVSRGELGTRVDVAATGEVAELVVAFNRMSAQLAELEAQRARWRAREHLAELGDLSRGLAHTLRNPLHTLGLAVEELSGEPGEAGPELVTTVRTQIGRIDRWLKSFLALGAGEAAQPTPADLRALCEDIALESAGGRAQVEVRCPDDAVTAAVVAPAIKAALSNLVANAVEASPEGGTVVLTLSPADDGAVITVEDEGPGLPEVVRARLFSPHTTTKAQGSGMGLYLARQLIEGGHGGRLAVDDRPGGGTLVTVYLPRHPQPASEAS